MGMDCSTHGRKDTKIIKVGKPGSPTPLRRPRCRWQNNIEMDRREVALNCSDWIELAQGREKWRTVFKRGRKLAGRSK